MRNLEKKDYRIIYYILVGWTAGQNLILITQAERHIYGSVAGVYIGPLHIETNFSKTKNLRTRDWMIRLLVCFKVEILKKYNKQLASAGVW